MSLGGRPQCHDARGAASPRSSGDAWLNWSNQTADRSWTSAGNWISPHRATKARQWREAHPHAPLHTEGQRQGRALYPDNETEGRFWAEVAASLLEDPLPRLQVLADRLGIPVGDVGFTAVAQPCAHTMWAWTIQRPSTLLGDFARR